MHAVAAKAGFRQSFRVLLFHRGKNGTKCEALVGRHHALRWTATELLEAEKKFRKGKGYRELDILQRKLNPPLTHQEQVTSRAESREPLLSTNPAIISP
jgi:hypothetical protein